MDRLRLALRRAAVACLALVAASGAAQDAPDPSWTVSEAFPPGAVLYTADDVGDVEVATTLFRVGADGATAEALPGNSCEAQCMVFAVRVLAEAGRLVPTSADRQPGSWLVVFTRAGTRVELDGMLVAQSKVRLRVPPGDHELTFRFENGEVKTQSHSVPEATEVFTSELPSRNAPPSVAPALVAAATISPDLVAGLLDLVASRPDDPATGWRMPEPVVVAPPVRPSPRPAPPPPDPEPAPPEPAPAPPEPEVAERSVDPEAPTCEVDTVMLSEEALGRIRRAEYESARACLVRLRAEGQNPAAAQTLLTSLDLAIAEEAGAGEASRAYLPVLRLQAASAAERGDTESLVDAVGEILEIVPADPSAVALLRDLSYSASGGAEDVTLAFAFIPGTSATRTASRLVSGDVSALGFLLSTTEVTNAQFADFLNQMEEVPRTFLIRRPVHLEETRREGWQPREGVADQPVVDATWLGASAYANWVGGRLPTAGEWTWAYRVGAAAEASAPNLRPESGRARLVASNDGEPDGLGLLHMVGNVWEWLASRHAQPSSVQAAGGSYTTSPATLVAQLTQSADPTDARGDIGFRVLRPLIPTSN